MSSDINSSSLAKKEGSSRNESIPSSTMNSKGNEKRPMSPTTRAPMPVPGRDVKKTISSPIGSPIGSPHNSRVNHSVTIIRSDNEDGGEGVNGEKRSLSICRQCKNPISSGPLVRALDDSYHVDCFRCLDCNEVLAQVFFLITGPDGQQYPMCEQDYFRRLNLLCDTCKKPLRGSYIMALDRKYHMDHFSCSACDTVFGPKDSYYEHEGRVYCHYHYSVRFAGRCAGCSFAIMKQFVEINKPGGDEHWHPECYMINKFWNVRPATLLKEDVFSKLPDDVSPQTIKRLKYEQDQMEEKVYQIWTALSAFEESSAACISEMLLHVSSGAYLDGVRMAGAFIVHVEVLFNSIDMLEEKLAKFNDNTGLVHTREPKLLCKRVIGFFTILSHTEDSGVPMVGVTQELLHLVTRLAHFLKNLIRVALTAALRLEYQHGCVHAIYEFLNKITELADQAHSVPPELDLKPNSDACQVCQVTLEEPCICNGVVRWHTNCFKCSKCQRPLHNELENARMQSTDQTLWCVSCAEANKLKVVDGFKRVTQLEQYTFLLRVAQQRLTNLLHMKGEKLLNRPAPSVSSSMTAVTSNTTEGSTGDPLNALRREPVLDKRLSNTTYLARRQTLVKHQDEPTHHMLVDVGSGEMVARSERVASPRNGHIPNNQAGSGRGTDRWPSNGRMYLSELSGLPAFIVRHLAVLLMAPLVEEYYTLDELLELIDTQKNTLWSRFKTSLKQNKKAAKEGIFGVPLDVLVERSGIDSTLGVSPGLVRVPEFIDQCITIMRGMDVTVEGIFRKNGNIRRLGEQIAAVNKNLATANLKDDNPIQLAALLKRFLREMPDPLLTFKLHKVFTTSQRIEDSEKRKKVLHYACCMLPEENRQLMEVLFVFFKWVSSFAYVGEDRGNKMDLSNMATVITPNILYSKSKDPSQDDSFLANEAVLSLLYDIENFALVPEEIADILNEDFTDCAANLSSKDLLKKCENVVRLRRNNSQRRINNTNASRGPDRSAVGGGHAGDTSHSSHAQANTSLHSSTPQSPPLTLADRTLASNQDHS